MQLKLKSEEIRYNEAQTGIKRRTYLFEMKGLPPSTLWTDLLQTGHNRQAKAEQKTLLGNSAHDLFDTPKPEKLLAKILNIATNENDLVLDSFLGSGTTAAVAHKMGRRWIGIEMGEHAATHCLPRMQKVIDGEQGGISKSVGWGDNTLLKPWTGGGFRFMRLGNTVFDETGRINPQVRFATLAAFIWQQETGTSFTASSAQPATPYLGTHYKISSGLLNSYVNNTVNFSKDSEATPETAAKPALLGAAPSTLATGSGGPADATGTSDAAHSPAANLAAPLSQFALYLLFNGILGDTRPASGNVLTQAVLEALLALHATTPEPAAPLLVYGEACRLGEARLKQANVTFKHIPYDVRAR